MSNTDNLAEKKAIAPEEPQQKETSTAKPLHRQFSSKFVGLLLTLILTLALIFMLFYQQSERSRLIVDGELTPLKQQFEQLQALQKAEYLVNELLLNDNGENFVALQTELIAVNRQLLRLESSNAHLYQQWLNANKSARDIVLRIQASSGRNEQLKQSSIIQLQLMWFSITPLIDKKIEQQEILFKQLQADQIKDKLTLNRANAYVRAIQQSNNLQQLKSLLAKTLTNFEQLSIHTSMDDFNLLRVDVEQIIAQAEVLKKADETKAMVDFVQQIATFEEIAVTQQRALAKWQGYIRLEQSYQLDLQMQKIQLIEILKVPQENISVYVPSLINELRVKFNINLTQQMLSMILVLAISFCLLVFCYLLWRLREKIKVTAQDSVTLIHKSLRDENSTEVQANCAETQEIMRQVQSIAKPVHDEEEFQQLFQQCQEHQQVIEEQTQALNVLAQSTNQQKSDIGEQAAFNLEGEIQRYKLLEDEVLSFIQQQHAKWLNKPGLAEKDTVIEPSNLMPVYEQLRQFYLVSEIRSEKAVRTLTDVNLIDEIHAVLMSKQAEQESFNNKLYFSYDEQLLLNVKLDCYLYQQLLKSLLDIVLLACQNTQLHFHLQLKDKSAGQQLVSFVVKVKTKMEQTIPDLIAQLVDSQTTVLQSSPLVDIFNIIFAKQHGENITAQLIDGGFQLSFELPLAIASATALKETQENKLDGIQVMLLSSNKMLTGLLEHIILSASGKLAALTRIDSFEQQFTAKKLSKHEFDILILDGYFSQSHLGLITQKINNLPKSLQPKLMVLQSTELNCDDFGFYSQADQLLFKDVFIQEVEEVFASDASTNQLLSPEQCQQGAYSLSGLPVLLAVNSPQKHINIQRLLRNLGLRVQVVSHAVVQQKLWKTGMYCILFTEFLDASLVKMARKPLMDVAVFSLTDDMPNAESDTYFDDWHIAKLTEHSTLAELRDALAPWLNAAPEIPAIVSPEGLLEAIDAYDDEEINELVITELATSLAEDNNDAAFDFSQYLQHQGSVELALFMLDDYANENHQQLDVLIHAIKAKELTKAKEAIIALQLNAKILSAAELDKLCSQWSQLLSGNGLPSSVNEMNTLLKDTRTTLTAIDSYAESI